MENMKPHDLTRRAFLAATTTTALMTGTARGQKPNTAQVVPGKRSPNELLNLAGIGVGGKGRDDILSCKRENVVAVCDVDFEQAGETIYRLPDARQFHDYRKMLDEMGDQIDAVTVSTPDHTHAPAAYMAMKMGKHVYVQKPLTHTVAEARLLATTAREMKVASQMGNQGHSGEGVRGLCEIVWSGVIGAVREAHVWTDRPQGRWAQGVPDPLPEEPVPGSLDWDLWIGAAPMRPYNKGYAPHKWRGWWDFGCGALGDMACHIMDPAFSALKLGEAAQFAVEVVQQEGKNDQSCPVSAIVKYSFPARGDQPPVEVYWYDNGLKPKHPEGVPETQEMGDGKNGSIFIGEKGVATAGEYGGKPRLLPDEKMKDFTIPTPSVPRVSGGNHYRNWIEACKGGEAACSNFDYSGPFTELVLLGCVALRTGRKLEWDSKQFKVTNDPEANALITKSYRKGWELPV
jgi:predicted dehydrogenase